ncbi:hypothetical protein M8J75_010087 [Diaphorina citri]|nr:hypothetical protein M8J75_010087 [Diaphorina citri]
MFMFVTVGFLIKLKLGAILTLYSYLKNKIIAKANKNIYDSCKRKVILILRVNLILCICLVVGFILDTWLPITPRRMELMKSLYHLKPPYRKLPQMVRIPFVESYSLPVYVVFYLLETHASVLCLASLYFISSLEITFTVPLTGQYEMLCEFVRLIGREQRDGNGERMFYTDVANGGSRYVTEPELYGKQRLKRVTQSSKWISQKMYEKYFVREIIIRHQTLVNYQAKMGFTSHLTTGERVKIFVEFMLIMIIDCHFIEISEKLDDCNHALVTAIIESNWYLCFARCEEGSVPGRPAVPEGQSLEVSIRSGCDQPRTSRLLAEDIVYVHELHESLLGAATKDGVFSNPVIHKKPTSRGKQT